MATVLLPESPAGAPAPACAPPAVEIHPSLPPPELRDNPRPWRGRFLVNLALGATLMALVHLFVVQISVVRGHSMEPALQDGDRLVVDRVSCTLGQVQRNEIVVLRCPRNPEVDYVKRIVGLPGDRIEMRRGRLYVNGELLIGDYQPVPDEAELPELTVPEGHYYVLGDNRPVSCDSREFGLVAQELLRGRVRARFWPPDRLAVF
jgi:signal peptidase I